MFQNDLFCLQITLINDPLDLLVDGARHMLTVTSRMREIAADEYLILVIIIIDQADTL